KKAGATQTQPIKVSAAQTQPMKVSAAQAPPMKVSAQEPAKAGATQTQPIKVSAAQTQPMKVSAAQAPPMKVSAQEPAKAGATQTQPIKVSAAQTQPTKVSAAQETAKAGATETAKAGATQTQPIKVSAAQTQPTKVSAAQEPAKVEAAQTQPAKVEAQTQPEKVSAAQAPAKAGATQTKPAKVSAAETAKAEAAQTKPTNVSAEQAQPPKVSAQQETAKSNAQTNAAQEPVMRWAKEAEPETEPEVYGQEDKVTRQREMRTLRTLVPSDAPIVDGRERDPLPVFAPEALEQNEQSLGGMADNAAPNPNVSDVSPPIAPVKQSKGVEREVREIFDANASAKGNEADSFRRQESVSNPFPEAFPQSNWVRIRYPGTTRYYLEGEVVNENGRFTIHALPGEYAPVPPNKSKGFTRFLRASDGSGYWLRIRRK
ncbi:MAG: hypothetical protein AAGU74_13285, partial [Bacillota bacterium]